MLYNRQRLVGTEIRQREEVKRKKVYTDGACGLAASLMVYMANEDAIWKWIPCLKPSTVDVPVLKLTGNPHFLYHFDQLFMVPVPFVCYLIGRLDTSDNQNESSTCHPVSCRLTKVSINSENSRDAARKIRSTLHLPPSSMCAWVEFIAFLARFNLSQRMCVRLHLRIVTLMSVKLVSSGVTKKIERN